MEKMGGGLKSKVEVEKIGGGVKKNRWPFVL